jgi:hypothetical protein
MTAFKEHKIKVTTAGANGSATGTGLTETLPNGAIWEYHIDFHASAPASTVVTFTEDGGAGRTLFTAPAGNTDIAYRPRLVEHSSVGVAQASLTPEVIAGRKIKATVTLSNALTDCVVVTIFVLEAD